VIIELTSFRMTGTIGLELRRASKEVKARDESQRIAANVAFGMN